MSASETAPAAASSPEPPRPAAAVNEAAPAHAPGVAFASPASPAADEASPSLPPLSPLLGSTRPVAAATTNAPTDAGGEGDESPPRATKVQFKPDVTLAELIFEESPAPPEYGGDVCVRLYDEGKKLREAREKKATEEREKRAAKELEGLTFKPTIPDHGIKYEDFQQFHQAQVDWQRRKTKLFADKVKKLQAERDEDVTFKTEMTPKSKTIVDTMKKERRYRGPIKGWEDHFHNFVARVEQQNLAPPAHQQQRHSQRSASANNGSASGSVVRRRAFTPVISPHASRRAAAASAAATADRELDGAGTREDIFTKLYEDSILRTAAQRVVERTKIEKEMRELFRPATNDTLWHADPLHGIGADGSEGFGGGGVGDGDEYGGDGNSEGGGTTSSLRSFRRNPDQVVESLMLKGEEYRHRREELRRAKEAEDAKLNFKPKTNRNSQRLVQKYANVTPRALQQQQQQHPSYASKSGALITTLSPDVKGIQEKPVAKFDADLFWSRMERSEAIKAQKIEARRAMLEISEVTECTFRPSISKVSEKFASRAAMDAAAEARRNELLHEQAQHSKLMAYQRAQGREGSGAVVESWTAVPHAAAGSSRAIRGNATTTTTSPAVAAAASRASPSASNSGRPTSAAASMGGDRHHQTTPTTSRQRLHHGSSPPTARGAQHTVDDAVAQEQYLSNLESELRGVIAEWQNISDA